MRLSAILACPSRRASFERRLWSKIERRGADECWPWLAKACADFGYGRLNDGRNCQIMAHQAAWALANGPIPAGLCVLHNCDNPPCCNPSHLFLGTKADNTHDMMRKGRMVPPPIHIGEAHPRVTLTVEKVKEIRRRAPLRHGERKQLAIALGVSPKNISDVIHGKVWNWVP
jgi:hypothetical protein